MTSSGLIRAGDLRHRVRVLAPSEGRDATGGVVLSWAVIATLWAMVEQTGGGEQHDGSRTRAGRDYSVTLRYRADASERWRISWDGREMEVESVTHDALRTQTVLACREEVR